MRLPIVFSLLFLTTLVCADGLANGFERMWIYYAFLLDVKLASVNGGTRSILLNCASDAKFRDVMAAISTKDISHLTILSDEENRFPPIRETAKRLLDIGLTERYDSEEVIKGQRSFTRMISDLGWMVNNIKSQLTPEQLAPMKDASHRANESLMLARQITSLLRSVKFHVGITGKAARYQGGDLGWSMGGGHRLGKDQSQFRSFRRGSKSKS